MSNQKWWILLLSVVSACGGRSPGFFDGGADSSCRIDGEGGGDALTQGGQYSRNGGAAGQNTRFTKGGSLAASSGNAGGALSFGGAIGSGSTTTSGGVIGLGSASALGGAAFPGGGTASGSTNSASGATSIGSATSRGGTSTSGAATNGGNSSGGAGSGSATTRPNSTGGLSATGSVTATGGMLSTSDPTAGGTVANGGVANGGVDTGGTVNATGGTPSGGGGVPSVGGDTSAGGDGGAPSVGGNTSAGGSSTSSMTATGGNIGNGGSGAGGASSPAGASATGGDNAGGDNSNLGGAAGSGSPGGAGPFIGCHCGETDCGTCPATDMATRSGYRIDATETTNAEYAAFLATNPLIEAQPTVCSWNWTYVPAGDWPATGRGSQPVSWVDWCDAYAYCSWAGKRLCGARSGGSAPFLSNDDVNQNEWFAACTDDGAHAYPYGNTFDPIACNGADYGLGVWSPVGGLLGCEVTGKGIYDMSGNVYEWENSCSAWDGGQDICHARGGSFYTEDPGLMRCRTASNIYTRSATRKSIGFRCCDDI